MDSEDFDDFEDILESVGDYGIYQKNLILFFLITTSTLTLIYDYLFMLSTPDHWCFVSQLSNLSYEIQSELIRPLTMIQGVPAKDSCHMYDIDYDKVAKTLTLPYNDTNIIPKIKCDDGWEYDRTLWGETATTHFNLVCNDEHYVSLLLSLGSMGSVIFHPAMAMLSNWIGRRKSFLIVLTIYAFSCLSPILVRDFKSFVIARFIGGGVMGAHYDIPLIMVMESVGASHRTKVSSISAIAYSIGGCIIPLLAYITGDWVWLSIVQLSFTVPFFLLWEFLPQSAPWLITRGSHNEAYKTLVRIAEVNRVTVDEDLKTKIKEHVTKQKVTNSQAHDSTLNLIKIAKIRKTFITLTIVFIATQLSFYGLSFNTLNFHGNELLSYFLLSLIDIPALFIGWYFVDTRLGRRWTNTMFLFMSGTFLCIPSLFQSTNHSLLMMMSLCGKFGTAASYMIIYQQATELFPTTLRSQGIGISTSIAAVMGICTPYITYLGHYGIWIPMFVMGLTSIVAGIAASFLPETLNENLPQNTDEAIDFGNDFKYFSLAKKESNDDIEK